MTDQKVKFRDGLKVFVEEYFQEKEGNLSDPQRSQGLALFYLSEVFNKLYPGVLSNDIEDISRHIVDEKSDQGVDVIFSQDTHHYFIQCKYHGRSQKKSENSKEVLHFKEIFNRIHPEFGEGFKKNEKVLDALAEINWRQDEFTLIFISLSRANQDIRNYENKGIASIDHSDLRDINKRASFKFMSEENLNKVYRDVIEEKILVNVTLEAVKDKNENPWYLYKNKTNHRSFITTINASQIHRLHAEHENDLFDLNIRNPIGNTSPNKGIVKTAEKEPANFFFYNNGISAIASKVNDNPETGELDCESFSIINGAQTFKSISEAYSKLKSESKDAEDLLVMLRLTETSDSSKKAEFIEKITLYNNTQNIVKRSDFRSNDGVQTALAFYFKQISFQGKKYHYKNKRAHRRLRHSTTISLDDFCRVIHNFDKGPIDCFGGVPYLYDTGSNGGYYFLFGDKDNNQILETISQSQFDIFASKFFICETARELFIEMRKNRIEKEESDQTPDDTSPIYSIRALEGKHLILFTVGRILREIAQLSGKDFDDFLKKTGFNKPTWREDPKKLKLIEDAVHLSCDVLIQDYRNEYDKSKDFIHINWRRERETLNRLEKAIKHFNSFFIQIMYDSFST